MVGYFKREAKIMLLLPVFLIVLGVLATFISVNRHNVVDIDKCLDSGGKYLQESNECLYK